jgi:hypothetical protein
MSKVLYQNQTKNSSPLDQENENIPAKLLNSEIEHDIIPAEITEKLQTQCKNERNTIWSIVLR